MLAAIVTVAEMMTSLLDAGMTSALIVAAVPLVVGITAYVLRQQRRHETSQLVANMGIGVGFFALLVVICWTLYAASVKGMIGSTSVLVFVAPLYLLGAGYGVEHLLHPTQQEEVRGRIRKVLLFVIVLGVLYFILSRLNMHMIIWTNMIGFVFFILALIGILYFLMRRVV